MKYKLSITPNAEKNLDQILNYIIFHLCNKSAASHLMDRIQYTYRLLETNPFLYPTIEDSNLTFQNYRRVPISNTHYILIYQINPEKKIVYISGIFHEMQTYKLLLHPPIK